MAKAQRTIMEETKEEEKTKREIVREAFCASMCSVCMTSQLSELPLEANK